MAQIRVKGTGMLSIFQRTISELPAFRASPHPWASCAYEHFVHPNWGDQDAHELERYRFLLALQYECQPGDEDLVRYLFDQEVLARSNDSFQGCGDSLNVASYLLSRWKRPADFWRFATAKLANFDTYCGYDARYLCAAGIDVALAEFANTEHALKEPIRSYLYDEEGNCGFTAAEMDEWEKNLIATFSKRPDEEPLSIWIDRAIVFGLLDEGRALLDQLESSGTDLDESSLAHLREQVGDRAAALVKRRALLEAAEDDWDRVSKALGVAELLLKEKRPDEAWSVIQSVDDCLMRIKDWHRYGLGRMAVEIAFRIAIGASPAIAPVAFAWACTREAQLEMSTYQILTHAVEAATAIGDTARTQDYQQAAREERRRIDEELER